MAWKIHTLLCLVPITVCHHVLHLLTLCHLIKKHKRIYFILRVNALERSFVTHYTREWIWRFIEYSDCDVPYVTINELINKTITHANIFQSTITFVAFPLFLMCRTLHLELNGMTRFRFKCLGPRVFPIIFCVLLSELLLVDSDTIYNFITEFLFRIPTPTAHLIVNQFLWN